MDNQPNPEEQQTGTETPREPQVALTDDQQREVIQLVRKYKQSWFPKRQPIRRRVLEAFEFAKGNHSAAYDPDSQSYVDAYQLLLGADADKFEDTDLYKFATNYYQMLWFAFVSALSSQVPKTRALPENAERSEDIAMAKAFSNVQEIIERQNNAKNLHKRALTLLWLAGCSFRHTRYLVDANKAGTHKEPVINMQEHEASPARYVCPQCGSATPADQPQAQCQGCGQQLDQSHYYPAETVQIPIVTEYKDVPNGMVAQTWYSPLEVDADPHAKTLDQTAIINVETEVDIAAARQAYPEKWDSFMGYGNTMSADGMQDRMAREAATTEASTKNHFLEERVTISRTWIQPWAFNKASGRLVADKLREQFPDGMLLVNSGDTFLDARKASISEEWSWAGTVIEEFGLFPPGVGDAAISVQKRLNDVENLTHEYMDRIGLGISFVNVSAVDTKALSGKPILPGVLNGIALKRAQNGAGPTRLEDLFHHFQATPDQFIYQYRDKLIQTMQLLAGTPPQIFGGSGDPNIQTMGGQQQQLNTAMGKLSLFWDNLREEAAKAAELAVKCAAKNMTDDWFTVVTDESADYRNEYVRLDEMQGNVRAFPDTDQGFPMTHAEIKAWWDRMIEGAVNNPIIQTILDDPANMEAAATFSGVPGLEVPGKNMRSKVMRILDKISEQEPQQVPAPDGSVQIVPSIMPEKDVDDYEVIVKTVKEYLQKNFEMKYEKPAGYENCCAYLRLAAQMAEEEKIKAQMPPPGMPPPQGAPPPQ